MRITRVKVFAPLLLLVLCSAAAEVRADPVQVTGYINFDSANHNFSLQGSGLSVQGSADRIFLGGTSLDTNFGATASLSRFLDHDDLIVHAPLTVGGVQYTQWAGLDDFITLDIVAAQFAFPVDPSVMTATFSSTFSMTGQIGLSRSIHPDDWQTVQIAGQGLATAVYDRNPFLPNLWTLRSLNYTLQPAQTPEPATLVLLLTGVGGVAARVRRGRRGARGA
ncbi:MAG TPA: PEP-CTERM sorting domain-containing protein [Pyrinomonadaceae bacterium]|jgi:hypothetical protein